MTSNYASALETKPLSSAEEGKAPPHSGVCILVEDSMTQRLIEGAAIQFGVETSIHEPSFDNPDVLAEFELIIADRPTAERVRLLFKDRRNNSERINPGIIAVVGATDVAATSESTGNQQEQHYDGYLVVPQRPAQLVAQLSLLLYAHRSFARRYHDALEELHLNRRIFRSVTSGISVANAQAPDLPLTYVNPAFEVMTGYALEEVLGKNCRFLQGDQRDQSAIVLVREAIAAGREVTVVLKNFRKDGSPFWNELSLSPIRNRQGEVTHFVGIQTDVTSRVEFEDALRESEKLAAVGRLASSIAHEINNPLESVMNLVYLAKRSDNPDETKTYLTTADSELQRVKLITTQSLRFFKQSTRPQAVNCTDLIDSVLSLYHSRLQNSNVSVQRRDRFDDSIVCMESEVRQVLNNLVSNALDAMRSNGGHLIVRTRKITEPRSGVEGILITFADTGHGIDADTLNHIYKAFYTTKGIGGTGLGLWISSEIVERHKGRMLVRSATSGPRTGTIFELFLPYQGVGA
ncbi:MAG: PAS domain-containing protein [Acidobacteria bacterium]|nr:PAS domain-containing protein [Acidobacteriota bacterium]